MALRPVGERRRNHELALFADLHPENPLFPPFDDAALAEHEVERLLAVARAVELFSIRERPHVVNTHDVAILRRRALARRNFRDRHGLRRRDLRRRGRGRGGRGGRRRGDGARRGSGAGLGGNGFGRGRCGQGRASKKHPGRGGPAEGMIERRAHVFGRVTAGVGRKSKGPRGGMRRRVRKTHQVHVARSAYRG